MAEFKWIFLLPLSLVESAPRITIHTLTTIESCTHEVAVPPNQEYVPLKAAVREPAKTYPFQLDPFQTEAILCIENNQVQNSTGQGLNGFKIVRNLEFLSSFQMPFKIQSI